MREKREIGHSPFLGQPHFFEQLEKELRRGGFAPRLLVPKSSFSRPSEGRESGSGETISCSSLLSTLASYPT